MSETSPSVPAAPTPLLPLPLRPLARVEEALSWMLAHPLLTVQIVVFWLIAWGGLGADLGLENLFWHESVTPQFLVGLSVGLLFEQILFLRYLLQRGRLYRRFPLTLYPVKDQAIRGLGRFMVLYWPVTLAALVVPKLLSLTTGDAVERHLPLLVGLGVSVTGSTLLVMLGERLGLRARVQRSLLFRATPGVAWGFLEKEDYPRPPQQRHVRAGARLPHELPAHGAVRRRRARRRAGRHAAAGERRLYPPGRGVHGAAREDGVLSPTPRQQGTRRRRRRAPRQRGTAAGAGGPPGEEAPRHEAAPRASKGWRRRPRRC